MIETVWVVRRPLIQISGDNTEGQTVLETDPVVAYSSTEELAKGVAREFGWNGEDDGTITTISTIKKDGQLWILKETFPITVDDYEKKKQQRQTERDEELRRKTLQSLTADQIRVLGLGSAASGD